MSAAEASQKPSDGRSPESLANGRAKAASPSRPLGLPDICFSLRRRVKAFLDLQTEDELLRRTQSRARESVSLLREALQRYGLEELSISYNGGKDCLVLLVLALACLPDSKASSHSDPQNPTSTNVPDSWSTDEAAPPDPTVRLQAIYIVPPDPFPEVEEFVASSIARYCLDLARYPLPMRPALENYKRDKPAVKAILMGTRRTDPHSEFLNPCTPTDQGWPSFMRLMPILDWPYAEIWAFIGYLDIPFCSLYNQGFTSLGGRGNTTPNPALALDGDGKTFRPAYELARGGDERLGRNR